jgi:hypothetical protein
MWDGFFVAPFKRTLPVLVTIYGKPRRQGRAMGGKPSSRAALITGARSGGVGEMVQAFAAESACVMAHFNEYAEKARALAHER